MPVYRFGIAGPMITSSSFPGISIVGGQRDYVDLDYSGSPTDLIDFMEGQGFTHVCTDPPTGEMSLASSVLLPHIFSGSNYTLDPANRLNVIMTSASINTITIDTNAAQNFPEYCSIRVTQWGPGKTSFSAAAGVDLQSPDGLTLSGQYARVELVYMGNDEWSLGGDLEAP